MTENEALLRLQYMYDSDKSFMVGRRKEIEMAMQAIKENQQYHAFGTVEEIDSMFKSGTKTLELSKKVIETAMCELEKYRAIGTVEEFKVLLSLSKPKKLIRNDLCTCPSCGTYNETIKKRRITVAFDTVFCWHCGQAMKIKREE